jgi:hypothetical protein
MARTQTAAVPLFRFFGTTFLKTLDAPMLVVGGLQWSREQLADIGITHMGAARMITEIAKDLRAKSVRELYDKLDVRTLAGWRGRGLTCLFVLWRLFESQGLDSVQWYARGREGAIVTFLSVKRNEHLTAKRSKKKSGGRQEFKPTQPGKPIFTNGATK